MSLRQKDLTEIEYPETDGQPMAETDLHRDLMAELIAELKRFFEHDPRVYVSGNLLLYYVEGNPRKSVSPDVFVVRGVGNHRRRIYKLWEEGQAPEVVIEISSGSTWSEDLQRKWRLYEDLGVKEYFIFDPEYDYLQKEPLLGYRLEEGQFVKLEVPAGRVRSEVLGLELVDTDETLRLFDPQTGEFLRTSTETERALHAETEARQRAEARVRAETEACRHAEEEAVRLREELTRLRSQS